MAIRHGEIDFLVAQPVRGPRVHMLTDADTPFRTFVEEMQHGAATISADGTILYCNQSLPAMLRTPIERVVGAAWQTLVAHESAEASDQLLIWAAQAKASGELILRTANGTLVPVGISAHPLNVDGVHMTCLVITDLTERKRAEQQARTLAAIVEAKEDEFRLMSRDRALAGFGFSPTTARGYGIAILAVAVAFLARWMLWPVMGGESPFVLHWPAIVLAAWYGGFRAGVLATVLSALGTAFYFMEPTYSLAIAKTADQVALGFFFLMGIGFSLLVDRARQFENARVAAEAEAHTSQATSAYYRSLIEANLDPMVIKGADGKITDVNHAAETATGRTRAELIGTEFPDYFTELDKARQLYQQVQHAGWVRDYPLEIRHRDGHRIPVLFNAAVYRDQAGNVVGVVATVRDISERKRAEAEILQLNADLERRVQQRTHELEAANKELEAFAYSVSHDLRSPLRAIDGFSQILLKEYLSTLPEKPQHYLQIVCDNARQMGRLIDDLLRFSRSNRQSVQAQPVDPGEIVRACLEELQPEREGRQVEIQIGELPECWGDGSLLKQVWFNLLSNALKYTRKRERARIEIGSEIKDGEIIYFVRDNGVGFDMQYAHKLFGVFQRLHAAEDYEGTGIGLALVQRILHRHGGRIWADAKVDQGAAFYFTLGRSNAHA